MKTKALQFFECPQCKSTSLSIHHPRNDAAEVREGHLICIECRSSYLVRNSIPHFVSEQNYTESFGFQWSIHDKTQLDSHTGRPISRDRLFRVAGWPSRMEGQVILEAGSGAGRFTEVLLSTGAEIFSFDYSSAVESNWRNNGHMPNLNLFQADMFKIPLRRGVFDKVICLGVLQHTPSPETAFKCLSEMVRPGGELVVDIYRKDPLALLQWKYFLRPITTRMNRSTLYSILSRTVPFLLPMAKVMRSFGGRVGARLVPVVDYSHLGLPQDLSEQWAVLDTFDIYAPPFDYPQTFRTLQRWYKEAGFADVSVTSGPNGLIGKGYRPECDAPKNQISFQQPQCAESSV